MLEASLFSAVSKTRPITIPSPRAYHSMAADNRYVYIAGGVLSGGTVSSKEVRAYDTVDKKWLALPDLPAPMFRGSLAVSPSGKLVAHGGSASPNPTAGRLAVASTYVLNSLTDSAWVTMAPGPTALLDRRVAVFNNLLYYHGGYTGVALVTNLNAYNVDTNTWSTPSNSPATQAARGHGMAKLIVGGAEELHVFIGLGAGTIRKVPWLYSGTGWASFTGVPAAMGARWNFAMRGVADKYYVHGGANDTAFSTVYRDMWEYNATSDVWTQVTGGPGARVIHDMAVCNGKLYLFGGAQSADTTYLGDFWEFNPTGRVWTKIE